LYRGYINRKSPVIQVDQFLSSQRHADTWHPQCREAWRLWNWNKVWREPAAPRPEWPRPEVPVRSVDTDSEQQVACAYIGVGSSKARVAIQFIICNNFHSTVCGPLRLWSILCVCVSSECVWCMHNNKCQVLSACLCVVCVCVCRCLR
jgi:hypothetical protein